MFGYPVTKATMSKATLTKAQVKSLAVDELVMRAQQNDMDALEALVERHQKLVYVTLYQLAPERNDIADLTQDVLLRMCRSIKSLREPTRFKYWLNRIITNLFYDELRKTPRQVQTISMDAPQYKDSDDDGAMTSDIPDQSALPDRLILNNELDQHIQKAIEALPEHFRTVIVLREIQKLSYDEIASLTKTELGTVKSRIARARLRLQETLKPYLEDSL
jgi:RNA polymerase sigma-70 factor (ECF subfamily)